MAGFKLIEGAHVIVSQGGVYKQVGLAERHGVLYAVAAGGYVAMFSDASTTKDKLRIVEISHDDKVMVNAVGRLCTPEVEGAKAIKKSAEQLLLGN